MMDVEREGKINGRGVTGERRATYSPEHRSKRSVDRVRPSRYHY